MMHDLHRLTVEQNRARAAHAVLTADVSAGQSEILSNEIAEEKSRLDVTVVTPLTNADFHPRYYLVQESGA